MTDFTLQDSGEREDFDTGARRDTQKGKGRPDLIPTLFIKRLAMVLERGATKYGDRNWEKGMPLSRYYASAMRHMMAAFDGEQDEDHLAQAAFNICGFMWTQQAVLVGALPADLNDLPHLGAEAEVKAAYIREFVAQIEVEKVGENVVVGSRDKVDAYKEIFEAAQPGLEARVTKDSTVVLRSPEQTSLFDDTHNPERNYVEGKSRVGWRNEAEVLPDAVDSTIANPLPSFEPEGPRAKVVFTGDTPQQDAEAQARMDDNGGFITGPLEISDVRVHECIAECEHPHHVENDTPSNEVYVKPRVEYTDPPTETSVGEDDPRPFYDEALHGTDAAPKLVLPETPNIGSLPGPAKDGTGTGFATERENPEPWGETGELDS